MNHSMNVDIVWLNTITFSFAQDRMWSFSHNFFNFDPLKGDLNVAGQAFQWNDGIFSITLGKKNPDGYRTAYFHPMASTTEFTVSTQVLRNEQAANRSYHGQDFKVNSTVSWPWNNTYHFDHYNFAQHLGIRGENSQSAMHQYHDLSGVIFYSQVARNGFACWNTNTPFTEQNHVLLSSDSNRMIYPADLTVRIYKYGRN